MSTRCQIIIDESDVVIYRHGDGYPDTEHGVLAVLLPICANMHQYRGFHDPHYLPAQIAHELVAHERARNAKMVAQETDEKAKAYFRQYDYLGIAVEAFDGEFHGDIAFVYVVKPDCVEVRRTLFTSGPYNLKSTEIVKWVDFKGEPVDKDPVIVDLR